MNGKRHRVQFEFSERDYERLQKTREKSDAWSYAQVVRDAVTIYDWLLDRRLEGYNIAMARDGEQPVRIDLPHLSL